MCLFSKMCMVLGLSEGFDKGCTGVSVAWESILTTNGQWFSALCVLLVTFHCKSSG